jgi:hypothetical protein
MVYTVITVKDEIKSKQHRPPHRGQKERGTQMREITTVEELMKEIEHGNYNYYGLRKATDHDIELINAGRTYLDVSYDAFDNETSFDSPLNGTCAIAVYDSMNKSELRKRYEQVDNVYFGDTILLIADDDCEYGNDDNEVILGSNGCGADVVAVVRM